MNIGFYIHEGELLYIDLVIVTINIVHFNRALSNFYVLFLNISVFFFFRGSFFFLGGG